MRGRRGCGERAGPTGARWHARRMARSRPLPEALRLAPFRVSEAIALDVDAKRLRSSHLAAPFHGARSPDAVTDLISRCRAYEPLMLDGQWFSHTTAAQLWGLPLPRRFQRDERLHVSTRRREPHRAGVVGHRITAKRELRFHLGLLVSSPADAWCELSAAKAPDGTRPTVAELIEAGDRLLAWPKPLATTEEVERAVSRTRRAAASVRSSMPEHTCDRDRRLRGRRNCGWQCSPRRSASPIPNATE